MPLRLTLLIVSICLPGALSGADPDWRIAPREPGEALETFQVLHGFSLELVAAEPQVADPVDVAYDEEGRAYVAEMRDYPYPEEANAPPPEPALGRVRLLQDEDQDGRFESSTVFAEGLHWPTSVACWRGGVFVAAAPELWYFKDNDGDGKADVRQHVFTGFGRYNVQAIMNNLRWGLDHQLYGAASSNGGQVQRLPQPFEKPVSLSGRDFRFDPRSYELTAISGGARFGNSFDDWGQRFVCNIRNPVQHVVLDARYLTRNPLLSLTTVIQDVAESGDQLPVYRLSPPEAWRVARAQQWVKDRVNYPRSELIGAGFWTSSSGVTVYRGDAYPAEFAGQVFVGEVAGNLVHRQQLEPDGVTFVSRRADEGAEFIASRDNWFRPVNFANAPDGTLHILDMYRETIEHPWSIPDDIKAQLHLLSGNDRGRIYRLCPPGYRYRSTPRLSTASTEELVSLLAHRNAWHRETAHRLLFERPDAAAVPALRKMLRTEPLAVGRLHALWTLDGLNSLTTEDLQQALGDSEPRLRAQAVALAEARAATVPALQTGLIERLGDDDRRVRFAAVLAAGGLAASEPDASSIGFHQELARALAAVAQRDAADPWLRTALLCARREVLDELAQQLLAQPEFADRAGGAALVQGLAEVIAARGNAAETLRLVRSLAAKVHSPADAELVFATLGGLQLGLQRSRLKLPELVRDEPPLAEALGQLLQEAAQTAGDEQAPTVRRVQAIRLLTQMSWPEAAPLLEACLQPRQPRDVQFAAAATARLFSQPEVADLFIRAWPAMTPPLRQEIIEGLLSRPTWVPVLLEALERGQIPPGQLTIPQRARLTMLMDAGLRQRALALIGPDAASDRKQVIDQYQTALQLPAVSERGRLVFRRECMTCHRFGNEGHEVGPNLLTVRHRTAEEMLVHILDPNREVPPSFLSYQATLVDGRIITGAIAAETDASITLVRADNVRETYLRQEIEELASSGKSLMPEGLEQKLTPQDLADLIGFLKAAN